LADDRRFEERSSRLRGGGERMKCEMFLGGWREKDMGGGGIVLNDPRI